MTAPLVLLLHVALASLVGPLLARAAWVHRSPRWGVWAWQAVSLSVVSAVVLTGLTLALPVLPVRSQVAGVFRTTPLHVAEHYATPAGLALAVVSAVLGAALLVRVLVLVGLHLLRASRQRARQLDALAVVGVPHPEGFVVVEHDSPLVYCLPGRRPTIVVTSAAVRRLEPRELSLVLAHERVHLRARHDLALAVSAALARAFLGLRVLATAHEQVGILVEMQADDSARSAPDRRGLARALVTLSAGTSPTSALAAGDTAALVRVRRLLGSSSGPLRPRHGALVGLVSALALSAPLVLALAPAIQATVSSCWDVTHGA